MGDARIEGRLPCCPVAGCDTLQGEAARVYPTGQVGPRPEFGAYTRAHHPTPSVVTLAPPVIQELAQSSWKAAAKTCLPAAPFLPCTAIADWPEELISGTPPVNTALVTQLKLKDTNLLILATLSTRV